MNRLIIALVALCASAAAHDAIGAPVYLRSTVGQPWGLSGNETVMNNVFGVGNWSDLRYETVNTASLFSSSNDFIFMEGGDDNANELEMFLSVNGSALDAWVSAGGSLLLNAAPNEGNGMNFGFGVSLTYSDSSTTGIAANTSHPIYVGPQTPVAGTLTGSLFSHASVSGGGLAPIIFDNDGDIILGEKSYGAGHVIVGGLTLPFFTAHPQWTQPDTANLHHNLIVYASGQADDVVPEPSSLALFSLAGVGFASYGRARRRKLSKA